MSETLEDIANMCVWEFSYKHKGSSFKVTYEPGNPLYNCQYCSKEKRYCNEYLTVG